MATTPTTNPIPSESPRDLKYNAGKIDEFVNSSNDNYSDRFGIQRFTLEGLRQVARDAINAFGYVTLDSFEDGATLTLPNQVLRYEATGEYYRWDGSLPKIVLAASTPASSGGIGIGAWLSVGDASLRSGLADANQGAKLISDRFGTSGSVQFTQHQKNNIEALIETFDNANSALLSGARNIRVASGNHVISGNLTIPSSTTLILEPGAYFSGGSITNNGNLIASKIFLSGVPYPSGFEVIHEGNHYVSISPSFGAVPSQDDGTKWKLTEVNQAIDLLIPSRFSDVSKVLQFISGASLNAKTTVVWADGSYSIGNITPNVKNGLNLWFSGNENDRSLVTLDIGTGDGFVCFGSSSFAISSLTIKSSNWSSHGVWTGVSNGVLAIQGGRIYCKDVMVTKCYYGFQAAQGGVIDADSCESSEAGDGGFFAFNGGHINAYNCPSHDHYDDGFVAILGFGYVAEAGGTMWVRGATCYGSVGGIFANIGSSIRADNANCYGNGNGVLAKSGSTIEINDSTINSNINDNVYCISSTFTCFNSQANLSQNGSGIFADSASRINCSGSQTNSNHTNGVTCTLLSSAKLNSSHTSTGNTSSAYSPSFDTQGNRGSWIYN